VLKDKGSRDDINSKRRRMEKDNETAPRGLRIVSLRWEEVDGWDARWARKRGETKKRRARQWTKAREKC
jgi:hypothetical protein